MYINKMELVVDIQQSDGHFGHLELQHYRGFPVDVRQYETNVINEARTVLSLPSHPVFAVLIGVCCDTKPYLLVTMVYGNVHNGVYMCVCGLIVHCRQKNDRYFIKATLQPCWLNYVDFYNSLIYNFKH